jgi:hypothetical protein
LLLAEGSSWPRLQHAAAVPMQNRVANTHNHDVQQARQSLASDVSAQVSGAATLNNDTSLWQAVG